MSIEFLGKRISGAYTIPSGIVATAVPIIDYLFRHVPEVGVMTTKSIGPEPRVRLPGTGLQPVRAGLLRERGWA